MSILLDEQRNTFFVHLCLAVFCLNSVKKEEVYLCQFEDHSNTFAERDNQGTAWVIEHRTHEKTLGLFVHMDVGNLTKRLPSC